MASMTINVDADEIAAQMYHDVELAAAVLVCFADEYNQPSPESLAAVCANMFSRQTVFSTAGYLKRVVHALTEQAPQ